MQQEQEDKKQEIRTFQEFPGPRQQLTCLLRLGPWSQLDGGLLFKCWTMSMCGYLLCSYQSGSSCGRPSHAGHSQVQSRLGGSPQAKREGRSCAALRLPASGQSVACATCVTRGGNGFRSLEDGSLQRGQLGKWLANECQRPLLVLKVSERYKTVPALEADQSPPARQRNVLHEASLLRRSLLCSDCLFGAVTVVS